MQVTETSAEGLRRQFKIIIPASDIDERVNTRLAEIGRSVRLPGFRPGKVPMPILKKRYGGSVVGEVLEGAVNEGSRQTMTERGLRPALQPKIEVTKFDQGGDLEFTMDLEVLPEIASIDYGSITLERLRAPVEDSAVEESLARLVESQKRFKPLEKPRAAKTGDQVTIDYEGAVDGNKRADMKAEGQTLELGSGRLVPGFEDQLVGAKADDDREVTVTFPEGYPAEELVGKTAIFAVKVRDVQEPAEVVADDALAREMGMEDLAALKSAIRSRLEQEHSRVSRERAKRALMDRLADQHDFAVPAGMVEQEFESIWTQIQEAKSRQDESDPDLDRPEDELKAEYRAIAERRVRLGLLLSSISQQNSIEVTEDELRQGMLAEARRYPGSERQVLEFFQKTPQAVQNLRAPILEDKVVDFILEMANIEEREVDADELMRDPDADEDSPAAEKAAPAKAKKAPPKKAAPKKAAAEEKAAPAKARGAKKAATDTPDTAG